MNPKKLCTVAEIACSIAEVTGEVPLELAKEIDARAKPGKIRFFNRIGVPRERFWHPLFGLTTPGKDYPDGPWFFVEDGPYPHCKLHIVDAIKLLMRHEDLENEILHALGLATDENNEIPAPPLSLEDSARITQVLPQEAKKAYVPNKVWTQERLAEAAEFRAKHGTKRTAAHYGVSDALIRRKLPKGSKPLIRKLKPQPWFPTGA